MHSNQRLTLAGTITFAKGTLDDNNDLVTIGGANIKVDGTSGTFDGSGPVSFIIFLSHCSLRNVMHDLLGPNLTFLLITVTKQLYWDGKGGNGGVNKPKFVRLSKMSGSITGLTVIGSPVHTFAVNGCHGLTLTDITIDNRKDHAACLFLFRSRAMTVFNQVERVSSTIWCVLLFLLLIKVDPSSLLATTPTPSMSAPLRTLPSPVPRCTTTMTVLP